MLARSVIRDHAAYERLRVEEEIRALEELGEVADGRVAEDLLLTIRPSAQPLGEVTDQPGELAGEEPPLAAAGDVTAAGVLPGLAASADAGRMPPRLAGFESTFAAN